MEDHAYLKNSKLIKLKKDKEIKKVVFVLARSILIYLMQEKKTKNGKIIFIRLEQLYPFPAKTLANILKKYKNAEVIWCQEEPKIWERGIL